MFGRKPRADKRGTWPQALLSLSLSVALILGIRWALFEPYIIPSGSMIPTLLINDHILVNKFSYGLRLPFSQKWLFNFADPSRGDIIVFRSVEDGETFLVKRVVGVPGDRIEFGDHFLKVNDELKTSTKFSSGTSTQVVRVPDNEYFMMGDNRDNSLDSRYWGTLPRENILGRASLIWLSCEKMVEGSSRLCDFSTLRSERLFTYVR